MSSDPSLLDSVEIVYKITYYQQTRSLVWLEMNVSSPHGFIARVTARTSMTAPCPLVLSRLVLSKESSNFGRSNRQGYLRSRTSAPERPRPRPRAFERPRSKTLPRQKTFARDPRRPRAVQCLARRDSSRIFTKAIRPSGRRAQAGSAWRADYECFLSLSLALVGSRSSLSLRSSTGNSRLILSLDSLSQRKI